MKTIGKKSALIAVIEGMNREEPREDEFSAKDFLREAALMGRHMTLSAVRGYLSRLSMEGKLNVRQIMHNGKTTNFYSHP